MVPLEMVHAQELCLAVEGGQRSGGGEARQEEGGGEGEEVTAEGREDVGHNLSENPETGQSEVIGEEVLPEVSSSHGNEGVKEVGTRKEVEEVDPVSSTVTTVQLEDIGGLIEVSVS